MIYDLGNIIRQVCAKNKIKVEDDSILDLDLNTLSLARSLAISEINSEILKNSNIEFHLIGVHLTFRWKQRLIPGFTINEILSLKPDGFINVINNVTDIYQTNKKNPKWKSVKLPDLLETQYWLMEEEFITEMLADMTNAPIYLVSSQHNISNLSDLMCTNKKKIYLSYPITAIEKSNPQLLKKIQGPILDQLEKIFIVFNPLSIEDMKLTNSIPNVSKLTKKGIDIIKSRTVQRDYQFIDQSDAVVVIYMTEKLSPGVMSEIIYANRNGKPVYMLFPFKASPFLSDATKIIVPSFEELFVHLEEFAQK
jgi:hypothetical protein